MNPKCCDVVRLHQFEWHGPDRSDPAHWTPKGNQFTELAHVPNHFYYNVCLSVNLLYDCVCVHVEGEGRTHQRRYVDHRQADGFL